MDKFIVGVLFFLLMGSTFSFAGEEAKVTGNANLAVLNQYIFRGYRIGRDSMVFQPSMGISYRGFQVLFWANIDTDEHATQTFTPDRPGRKSWNETDLTLAYTYNKGKMSLTGGYIRPFTMER